MADIDRQHAHAMSARILHQLGRRVKTHGLGIEQRLQKMAGSWRLSQALA
jgi:hypothetical protein